MAFGASGPGFKLLLTLVTVQDPEGKSEGLESTGISLLICRSPISHPT